MLAILLVVPLVLMAAMRLLETLEEWLDDGEPARTMAIPKPLPSLVDLTLTDDGEAMVIDLRDARDNHPVRVVATFGSVAPEETH